MTIRVFRWRDRTHSQQGNVFSERDGTAFADCGILMHAASRFGKKAHVTSRRIELLDALHVVHAEAARLSEMIVALQASGADDLQRFRELTRRWQIASDRAKALHDELRALNDLGEEED